MCDITKLFSEFGYVCIKETDSEVIFCCATDQNREFKITKDGPSMYVSCPLKNSKYDFSAKFITGYEVFDFIEEKLKYLEG